MSRLVCLFVVSYLFLTVDTFLFFLRSKVVNYRGKKKKKPDQYKKFPKIDKNCYVISKKCAFKEGKLFCAEVRLFFFFICICRFSFCSVHCICFFLTSLLRGKKTKSAKEGEKKKKKENEEK